MWIGKFRIWHKGCLLRPKCIKHKIIDLVYIINSWKEKDNFYYTELHILQGTEENKKKFIKDLKKEKTVTKVEQKGNYLFTLNKEPTKKHPMPVFNPKIIQVKPVIQRLDGFEDWELGCWDKKELIKIMKIPVFEKGLKSIKNVKMDDIFLPHIYPKLSPKQKEAIELAVKYGYYTYPRRIYLDKLANISRVKRETFQESLRKAENKLVPFLTESLN